MNFWKMESLGNDFIVFGSPSNATLPNKNLITRISDRKYGVGADCVICISSAKDADFGMHVYNPNGFEAEICGNALRCTAKYIADNGFYKKRTYYVATNSGIRALVNNNDNITVEIGHADILKNGILEVCGKTFEYFSVSVGNPHCVIFVSSISDELVYYFGRAIENHPLFPNGTNVEFANIISDDEIEIRIWERGIGETLSCSTGSCAVVEAARHQLKIAPFVRVKQPGGIIEVETKSCGNMFITGRCNTVFKGNYLY